MSVSYLYARNREKWETEKLFQGLSEGGGSRSSVLMSLLLIFQIKIYNRKIDTSHAKMELLEPRGKV